VFPHRPFNFRSLLTACLTLDLALLAAWSALDRQWLARTCQRPEACLLGGGLLLASALTVGLVVLIVRRRAALAESTEAKFRSLLDAAPDPMVIIDGNGVIVLVNARAEQLFGSPREQLVGQPVDNLLQQSGWKPDPLHSTWQAGSSVPPGDKEPELFARRPDGASTPVEISFSPLETKEGMLTISIIRDITERRAAERLRHARHAVRRVLAEDTTLAGAGPRLLATLGEALGLDTGVLWTADAPAGDLRAAHSWHGAAGKALAAQLAEQDPLHALAASLSGRVREAAAPVWQDFPAGATPLPGRPRELREAFGFPVLFGAEVLGVVGCFRREAQEPDDALTETLQNIGAQVGRFLKHHQAEEALRASEARKAAVLEAALDAIITIDDVGKVQEFNPAAERLFGYAAADALGKGLVELVVPAGSRDAFQQALEECQRSTEPLPGKRLELTLTRADGGMLPVELAVTRTRTGSLPTFTCHVRDLRERKQAEEALKRAEEQFRQSQKMEAVGRLAGGVAHDFNNLLTAITGYTQVLLRKLPADDPSRGPVELIGKAGNRAADLTRQLLAFSRRQMLEPKVLDLNAVCNDLSKMLRRMIGEDIELATIPGADLRRIKADPGQVDQAIMNLVVNARDAMPSGGKLTIETRNVDLDATYARAHPEVKPGPYVLLAISDNGCGMDEVTKARIFEPFFTTKEVGKGTGLGLAMVYGVVKQSGGHVAVYSEVGHGTTFKIYLPATEERPAVVPPAPRPAAPPAGKGTVLLVEDEDMVRTLSRAVLQEQGYTVLEARHGREAIGLPAQEIDNVELTVTDVVMPGMDGRDLAQHLLRRKPNMKVLYVSGYTDNAIIRSGLLEPGTAFLEKPFTPEVLARKVHEMLVT
jgi:PAS domain S-box-containing protein